MEILSALEGENMDINKLMNVNLINLDLKGETKLEIIEEIVELLDKEGRLLDKEAYFQDVLKREEIGSTGVEMGVAIPHGKSSGVKEPSLAFGRVKDGVDFSSMDGNKTDLVFLIAVPENSDDTHIRILTSFARKLMHKEFRDGLRNAVNPAEIIELLNN